MFLVIRSGLCRVRQNHSVRVATLVFGRSMSSQENPKKPVSLLGTMAFGGRADAGQSLQMVQAFLDRGHSLLDTAFMYVDGKSEAVIGGMNLPETGSNRCRKTVKS